MAAVPPPLPTSALRRMHQALATASDTQLRRIVGVLDHLDDRGDADALIAPLRGRLAELHPPRPLTFARLLCLPLEPLLVPAALYTPGSLGIPRTAVGPLARLVRTHLGEEAGVIDAALAGGDMSDSRQTRDLGRKLWPAAAAACERGPMPTDWRQASGLGPREWQAITATAATVLAEGVWIFNTLEAAKAGLPPDAEELRVWLQDATACHPEPPGALLAVLLARLPAAIALIEPLASEPERCAVQAEPAIAFLLARIQAETDLQRQPAVPSVSLPSAVALLTTLANPGPGQRPSRLRQVEALRRRLDSLCRRQFQDDLQQRVLAPLAGPVDPEVLDATEQAARALRRLEALGRQLDGTDDYDAVLRTAAQQLSGAAELDVVERARLVEILAGTEAALTLLRR